jgi:hypothetical protein
MLLLPLFGTEIPSDVPSARVLWLDLGGKGQNRELSIADGWSLSHFATHMPWWDTVLTKPIRLADGRVAHGAGGPAPTNKLFWQPLKKSAEVKRLGTVDGIRTYQVVYSPAYHVVVWDRSDWSFVPAVIIAGDESIVGGVHTGRVFRNREKEILHVRIQFQGTGHDQQSLFFAAVDGALVRVQEAESARQQVAQFFDTQHIRPYFKGLGFCEDSLTEERLFETESRGADAALCIGCRVIIRYELEGTKLVLGSIGLADHKDDCEIFPKW